jgi:signal peptidase II
MMTAESGRRPAGEFRRLLVIAVVVAVVVAADQVTKTWALHHLAAGPQHVIWTLQFNLTFNDGIAFSQVTGATALVTAVALVVLCALLVVAVRSRGMYSAVVCGLVIGGALGNLVDRLIRHHGGGVIDFIDLRWWPVFNVADAAITIGVLLAAGRALLRPGGDGAGRAGRPGFGGRGRSAAGPEVQDRVARRPGE